MLLRATANVVVFIPPPVDIGEAPIHIRIRVKKIVWGRKEDKGRLLKPAVLGVTAAKNEVASFSPEDKSFRVLFDSNTKNRIVPPTSKTNVKAMTMRVVVLTILTCEGIRRDEPVSL